MRDRRPGDWRVDLSGRHPLEDQVAAAIAAHPDLRLTGRSTAALDRLDFQLAAPGGRRVELELKAKRQPYVGWARLRPEVAPADLFILDELALRRLVDAGRYAFLLVRDVPRDRWHLWSLAELLVCGRVRVGRRLATGTGQIKGKLLVDLAEAGGVFPTLPAALDGLSTAIADVDRRWGDIAPWPARTREVPA